MDLDLLVVVSVRLQLLVVFENGDAIGRGERIAANLRLVGLCPTLSEDLRPLRLGLCIKLHDNESSRYLDNAR